MLAPSLLLALFAPNYAVPAVQGEGVAAETLGAAAALHTQAPPQIRLNLGRVTLLDPQGQTVLIGSEPTREAPRAAHLEAGAGASLSLTWAGRASLHLLGPASLEWSEAPDGTPTWEIFTCASMNLEVRRGLPRLNLPGDWTAQIDGAAALYLETGSDGVAWVDCDAGEALAFHWLGDSSKARPARICAPGTSVQLGEPDALDDGARPESHPAWNRAAWAWPEWRESALPEEELPEPTSLAAALRRHSMHSRAIQKADPETPLAAEDPERGRRTFREGGPGADVRTASPLRFSSRRPIDRLARSHGGREWGSTRELGPPIALPADGETERTLASVSPRGSEDELQVTLTPLQRIDRSSRLDLPAGPRPHATARGPAAHDSPLGANGNSLALPSPRAAAPNAPEREELSPIAPTVSEQPSTVVPQEVFSAASKEGEPQHEKAVMLPDSSTETLADRSVETPENELVGENSGLSLPAAEPAGELSQEPATDPTAKLPVDSLAESSTASLELPAKSPAPAKESSAHESERVPAAPVSVEEDNPAAVARESATGAEPAQDPADNANTNSETPETPPEEKPEPAVFHVQDWHYLKRERIRSVAQFAVQDHPALTIEEQKGDLWRITLRADASANAWVFGTRKDLLLRPGAVVVLKPDGSLDAHFGRVRFDDVPEWRPSWAALGDED